MTGTGIIRETDAGELERILALYPLAFPEEDLQPLVSALIGGEAGVLSLATFDGETLAAHVLFTLFGGDGASGKGALLGPLGVLPDRQGQGIGTAIVRDGLERLRSMGVAQVFVLGDPAYYGRFGFRPERDVMAPYPLPPEWADAWQSLLLPERSPLAPGSCQLPAPWMNPALWGP